MQKGHSAGAARRPKTNSLTLPPAQYSAHLALLVHGGQNHRRGRQVAPLEWGNPSEDWAERRLPTQAGERQGVRAARALANCRRSLCDTPQGTRAFLGGPAAWTKPWWTGRTHLGSAERELAAAKAYESGDFLGVLRVLGAFSQRQPWLEQ